MVKKLLMMFMMAAMAVVTAMGQESFYVVMKDGSAEKFPVEKVDSLTFDNVEVEKVMGLGDLMKMVDALKNEVNSLREENMKRAVVGTWRSVKKLKNGLTLLGGSNDTLVITMNTFDGLSYSMTGDTLTAYKYFPNMTFTLYKVGMSADSLVITNLMGTHTTTYYVGMDEHEAMKKEHEALYAKIDSLEIALKSLNATTAALNTKSDFLLDKVLDYSFVDLGLESGTLWATYNVGATKPEGYGNYFAWGETMPKDKFAKEDGKWYGVEYSKLKSQGVIDANGNLTAKYDAASANWGNDWRMPTKAEIEELSKLTNKKAEINGVKGRIFIGTNGNVIFLPFAGGRLGGEAGSAGEYGFYWSATASENKDLADDLYMLSSDAYRRTSNRSNGFTVRPVLRTK